MKLLLRWSKIESLYVSPLVRFGLLCLLSKRSVWYGVQPYTTRFAPQELDPTPRPHTREHTLYQQMYDLFCEYFMNITSIIMSVSSLRIHPLFDQHYFVLKLVPCLLFLQRDPYSLPECVPVSSLVSHAASARHLS